MDIDTSGWRFGKILYITDGFGRSRRKSIPPAVGSLSAQVERPVWSHDAARWYLHYCRAGGVLTSLFLTTDILWSSCFVVEIAEKSLQSGKRLRRFESSYGGCGESSALPFFLIIKMSSQREKAVSCIIIWLSI